MYLDAQTSVEHPSCPPQKGFTRAKCFFSGTMMQKVSETQTRMYYVAQVDLAGWVPSFVANIVNEGQPLSIARLRDFAMSEEKAKKEGEKKEEGQ